MDPQAQQILQQLQQQMQQQSQQHAQELAAMQQQLQHAIAVGHPLQPPPVQAAAPAVPRPEQPRLPSPPTYDGKASALDDWLAALQRQFAWYAYATPAQDAQRLRFAAGFLTGAASDWWEHSGAATPQNWTAFVAALRARFQPVTSADAARAKLASLTQGKASVNDYVAAFRRLLVAVPDMAEADRLFQFTRGLRPAIATQLRVHGVKTLDAAVEMAARIGSLVELSALAGATSSASAPSAPMELDALLNVEGLERETNAGPVPTVPGPHTPVTQAQFAELLNAMREQRRARPAGAGAEGQARPKGLDPRDRRLPRIPHLTPVQVKEYMDNGKCFSCGSKEHTSRGCPQNPSKKQGN